jgi:hypothetical protein
MKSVPRSAWFAAVVGLAACGDDAMQPGGPEPLPVIARTDAADTATCPHGGVIVRSGHDRNGNGTLDDGEIAAATPVCQSAPVTPETAPPVRVRLDDEPAGSNCRNGGTAVRSGADTNRNGALDDDEIAVTDYVCDDSLLTRMESELAGSNCAGGGIAFHIGRDADLDGVLGADEVEWTEYECTDVLSRAVTVQTAADLAVLADIRVINGGLVIEGTELVEIDLPVLELVGGRVAIDDNAALTRVSLPALTAIDGYLEVSLNPRLAQLDLGLLRRIEGDLYLGSNPALTSLAGLDALVSVDRNLEIRDNAALAAADLPSLGLVRGDVTVSGNPVLAGLDLSLFEGTGDLLVRDNPALAAVELRVLSLWCSTCRVPIGAVSIGRNAGLTTVELYGGSFAGVQVVDNDALTTFTMRSGGVDGDVTVRGAAVEELSIYAQGSIDDLVEIAGTLSIEGPITQWSVGFYGAVVGGLSLEGTRLTTLERSGIHVRGDLELRDNDLLVRGDFLEVTGGVRIVDNDAFRSFWIFDLEVLAGDVQIASNAVLEFVTGLQDVHEIQGSLTIMDNPRMISPGMYGLRHVEGDVRLSELPALEFPGLSALETVGGGFTLMSTGLRTWSARDWPSLDALRSAGWVTIGHNQALEDIELSALQHAGDWFHVYNNPALRSLGLESLQDVESVSVWENPTLPVCEIQELFARTSAGSEHQRDNDDDGVCP